MDTSRRTFLKVLGGGAAGATAMSPLLSALADPPEAQHELFIFIHAAGGWDVTVSLDPRNARGGLVEPASTDTVDTAGLLHWTDGPERDGLTSFQVYRPSGCNIPFGPAIGLLGEDRRWERVLVINGIAMNTVSHPDGTAFSSTGRHLAGGRAIAASVDTMVSNEFGRANLFPTVSVGFPSFYVGSDLDPKVIPLRVDNIGTVARSLTRSNAYVTAADRDAVNALLQLEARDVARRSYFPAVFTGVEQQLGSLREMMRRPELMNLFSAAALRAAYPAIFTPMRTGPMGPVAIPTPWQFEQNTIINAAFAVESLRLGLARTVSFSTTSFDTHNSNYEDQPQHQQELFNMLALLLDQLDAKAHPTLAGQRLSDHTHILVFSEFCRTPQINISGGRDHYPNNSAVIISPRFRGNMVFGASDPAQLLPAGARRFADGMRSIAPPDVLATFLSAFRVDPRKYMRDGDTVRDILRV
ncbi:MAG: DUF1501 domain-containing protein [Deltaproteobacteria bacterium]|nr:DUF1501 domain-containing protein [Deltaproteobacteria bacterium]